MYAAGESARNQKKPPLSKHNRLFNSFNRTQRSASTGVLFATMREIRSRMRYSWCKNVSWEDWRMGELKLRHSETPHRWNPKPFRHTHGAYLRMDHPILDFATKCGQEYWTSSLSCFIRGWNSVFALVYNFVWLALRTFGRTLWQSQVSDDQHLGTHRECGEKVLDFTWWCFAVSKLQFSHFPIFPARILGSRILHSRSESLALRRTARPLKALRWVRLKELKRRLCFLRFSKTGDSSQNKALTKF